MKKNFFNENSYYEGLLQDLYCGKTGSFVSFMLFFYQYNQSIVFSPQNSDILKEMYLTELENCKILSEILLKVGGDNKYCSSARRFLSGNSVNYLKNFSKIYLEDIEFLEIAVLEIKNVIAKIDVFEIKNLLREILNNKKKLLKNLKEKCFKNNLRN